ncbi:hypothetical protein E4A48_11630 [Xanthomonas cerealis pv. cerealis]|uniref:Uncharacterized protein n=1 Tax=Xanthomonas cerealis pv. cerealis TaxID=152263 RepID=A0A514EDZ0_9XANT|nr:hypothetical protein [Xanthomonas translucens]QDI04256.1 hypothetical protein E4A48_11630 [Xanthomonas translucens pv. cerealis]
MNVEEFWNAAFLAALSRLPAKQAKKEADVALDLCVGHWQEHYHHWAPQYKTRWQEQRVANVPALLSDDAAPRKAAPKKAERKKGA